MAAVLGFVLILFVVVGVPMLCRMLVRRMAASQGLRPWLNAYGPRFLGLGRDEPDDGTDA
jgi:hypothetical protein